MFELFNRYAQLKTLEEERDELLRQERLASQARALEINRNYPTLDSEIQQVRGIIQGEVNTQPGKIVETDYGKAEIQIRTSWNVHNSYALKDWLDEQGKDTLYEFTFKKAEINKICTGLDLAGMRLPDGTEKRETPTLVITLNDTQRQGV